MLDAALDAAAALALVADELGDRCGTVAFDREIRTALVPRRAGGAVVVRALFDLEPPPVDSDYERAFRRAEGNKRALVLVLCDLLEEAAAPPAGRRGPGPRPPPRRRRRLPVGSPPRGTGRRSGRRRRSRPLGAIVAGDVLAARARGGGPDPGGRRATCVEAPPDRLPAAVRRGLPAGEGARRL